jgi:hypothetical protein
MEHVLNFFKNKWTKLGFSVLSVGYGVFMIWLAWLVFSFHLVPTNPVSLFALYSLINVLFGVVMVYTRKQIATKIIACLLHPFILIMLVAAFGNWYLLTPPFLVATVVFFASRSPEALKTILGTIYLILFIVAALAYMTLDRFGILNNIFPVDLSLRSPDYVYSANGTYRLVTYTDPVTRDDRNIRFYIELAEDDISLPFLEGERYTTGVHILTQRLANDPRVYWLDDTKLYIDGKMRDVSVENAPLEDEDEDEFPTETGLQDVDPPGEITKGTTTPPNTP